MENKGFIISEKRKSVWEKELEILEQIQIICDKHDIRYCAIAGTLIGAIRHNGFIPWDDDIDIAMPRQDYDKFLTVCKQELSPPFFIQTPDTDTGYYYGHAKVRNTDTTAIRQVNWKIGCRFNQGIFVDVFPLDSVPDDMKQRRRYLTKIAHAHAAQKITEYLFYEAISPSVGLKLRYCIYRTILSVIGKQRFNKYYENILRKYDKSQTSSFGLISESTKPNDIWEKSYFSEYVDHAFENRTIRVPAHYEEILTQRFGDWKTPQMEPNMHGEVFYDTEHSYLEYLNRFVDYQGDEHYHL